MLKCHHARGCVLSKLQHTCATVGCCRAGARALIRDAMDLHGVRRAREEDG